MKIPANRLRRGDRIRVRGDLYTVERVGPDGTNHLTIHARDWDGEDGAWRDFTLLSEHPVTVIARGPLTLKTAIAIAEGWTSMMHAADPGRWLYSFTSTGGIEDEGHRAGMLAYVDGLIADGFAAQDAPALEEADVKALRAYLAACPTRQSFADLDAFTVGYLDAALWATNDESTEAGGEPLDASYGKEDVHPDALAGIVADCEAFQDANAADLDAAEAQGRDRAHCGHDFFLTRAGHGTGFWDRGLGEVGDRLTEAAKRAGEPNFYVGDDNRIYNM